MYLIRSDLVDILEEWLRGEIVHEGEDNRDEVRCGMKLGEK